jgi:hypothetical protein
MELSSHLTEDGGAKTGGGYGNETPQRDRDDASVGAGGEIGTEGAAGEADAKGGEPTAVPGTIISLRSIVCCCTAASNFWLYQCCNSNVVTSSSFGFSPSPPADHAHRLCARQQRPALRPRLRAQQRRRGLQAGHARAARPPRRRGQVRVPAICVPPLHAHLLCA